MSFHNVATSFFANAKISTEGIPEVQCPDVNRVCGGSNPPENIVLIDVRRPDEFTGELGHIQGSTLVTLETQFFDWIEKAPRDKTYVFICRSGMRSGRATMIARSRGVMDCYNLEGGMIAWNEQGLPTRKT